MVDVVVAGQDVVAEYNRKREEYFAIHHAPKYGPDERYPDFQRYMHRHGYIEAEIVKSNYGYSVRYASGLQNWGIIYSSRRGHVDGTLEDAIDKAKIWQARDPKRRFVTHYKAFEGDE